MPRTAKPFYWTFAGGWFLNVTNAGKRERVELAKGPEKETRDAAFTKYHAIMALRGQAAAAEAPRPAGTIPSFNGGVSVATVLDRFLTFTKKNSAASTFAWHDRYLSDFAGSRSEDDRSLAGMEFGVLPVTLLKVGHVQEWIDSHDTWGDSSKSAAARSIRTAFNHAVEKELIPFHSICKLKAIETPGREVILDDADFEALLAAVKDPDFKDLLNFSRNTGCRPQEACKIEASHCRIDPANKIYRIELPPSQAKRKRGKTRPPRFIYLNDIAIEIVVRLREIRPTGKLFRNKRGPWNRNKIRCKFRRLTEKLGKQYCMYHLRHSWATDMLSKGVDSMILGVLADHADPSTLGRKYQHVAMRPQVMQEAANRASSGANTQGNGQ